MTIDGKLNSLLRQHLPEVDWVRIESGGTGLGIPDLNYCFNGREGWIELKGIVGGFKVGMRPGQVAWIERRIRHGGKVLIFVRKADEAWLFDGNKVRDLVTAGIGLRIGGQALVHYEGQPATWDWRYVRDRL